MMTRLYVNFTLNYARFQMKIQLKDSISKFMKILKSLLAFALIVSVSENVAFAQAPNNWFLLETMTSGFPGANVEKAYKELLQGKTPDTVVVAVIDSGTDYFHEDLASVSWKNTKEVAGDGIDNDGNGYVDDVYGWSFIGGPTGNVSKDSYELTRIYSTLSKKFADRDSASISKKERDEYMLYREVEQKLMSVRSNAEKQYNAFQSRMQPLLDALDSLDVALGEIPFSPEALDTLDVSTSDEATMGKSMVQRMMMSGVQPESIEEIKSEVQDQFGQAITYFSDQLEYAYNPDFDPRTVVGDNPNDLTEKFYGNNTAKGPDPSHGTHVSGIIAAARGNDIGMDGIADAAKLMAVRTVPDGDERDKDVANAIRYAVDNGAKVINMSFGKAYSPDKEIVDEAIRYADKKDVLMILAAGNSGQDNDVESNFPTPVYKKKKIFRPKRAKNWISVGAVGPSVDETMTASFSNYGKTSVDIFAPGHIIYSTLPENEYGNNSGTSMAAPMVAGVAALIRSYYPNLSASQVKEAILMSAHKIDFEVNKPGTRGETISFSELCTTGGILDAYAALEYASKMK